MGSAPNLVLNLDEMPVTAGGRNLDVHATDIARIEMLPGPRETLYGASSQAGTVRERITTDRYFTSVVRVSRNRP